MFLSGSTPVPQVTAGALDGILGSMYAAHRADLRPGHAHRLRLEVQGLRAGLRGSAPARSENPLAMSVTLEYCRACSGGERAAVRGSWGWSSLRRRTGRAGGWARLRAPRCSDRGACADRPTPVRGGSAPLGLHCQPSVVVAEGAPVVRLRPVNRGHGRTRRRHPRLREATAGRDPGHLGRGHVRVDDRLLRDVLDLRRGAPPSGWRGRTTSSTGVPTSSSSAREGSCGPRPRAAASRSRSPTS